MRQAASAWETSRRYMASSSSLPILLIHFLSVIRESSPSGCIDRKFRCLLPVRKKRSSDADASARKTSWGSSWLSFPLFVLLPQGLPCVIFLKSARSLPKISELVLYCGCFHFVPLPTNTFESARVSLFPPRRQTAWSCLELRGTSGRQFLICTGVFKRDKVSCKSFVVDIYYFARPQNKRTFLSFPPIITPFQNLLCVVKSLPPVLHD